jgi:3-phenylpropionate/cinnamic acid dioxygenase small subunit
LAIASVEHPQATEEETIVSGTAPDGDVPSRVIENLIATYAFLVDDGDFTALGELLDDAEFSLNGGPAIRGQAAVEEFARDTLQTYADGTPRTRHVTTNIIIEPGGEAGTAVSRSYFTVFQELPGFPLQAIASGRYHDRFRQQDGRWRFAHRSVTTSLVGDVSHHVRAAH